MPPVTGILGKGLLACRHGDPGHERPLQHPESLPTVTCAILLLEQDGSANLAASGGASAGSTYPLDSTAEQAALATQAELGAEVVGEAGSERSLASSDAQPFLLTAGMVGMAVNEAATTHVRRRLQAC